jgi:redox-sensitive bicupin YhaK (pirin superfamily)
MTDQVKTARSVERIITGQAVMDGAGVKINRVLTQTLQRRLDPFLMLDNFGSDQANDYIAGFPSHPHRGFETVTYMIEGRMRHKDSAGNEGLLTNGGVQWMTAGRGVIHSEMPEQEDGVMEGFQLWLNLPAKDKMRAPWYRDFNGADVPVFTTERAPGESDRRPQPWRGRRRAARGDRAAVLDVICRPAPASSRCCRKATTPSSSPIAVR